MITGGTVGGERVKLFCDGVGSPWGSSDGGGDVLVCAWLTGMRRPPMTLSPTTSLNSHGHGFKWAPVSAKDFWPRTLIDLCIHDEKLQHVLSVYAKRLRQGDQGGLNNSEGDAQPPPGANVIPPRVAGGSNEAPSNYPGHTRQALAPRFWRTDNGAP